MAIYIPIFVSAITTIGAFVLVYLSVLKEKHLFNTVGGYYEQFPRNS